MIAMTVKVVGAGLAGSEAAWQLAVRGVPVELIEMKPAKRTPAHVADGFAELDYPTFEKKAAANCAAVTEALAKRLAEERPI